MWRKAWADYTNDFLERNGSPERIDHKRVLSLSFQPVRSILCVLYLPLGKRIPIAIYHWNIGIVSRGKGKSAVAAAAYRSGEKLTNEWDGMTHDYTRKGGVVHTEIMLPPHAPADYADVTMINGYGYHLQYSGYKTCGK